MPLDPSIALGFQMPKFMSPQQAASQAMTLKAQMQNAQMRDMEMAQNMQSLKIQQEIARLAAVRSNIDPATGGLTPEALSQVSDPTVRQKLTQERFATQLKQKEIDYKASEAGKMNEDRQTKAMHEVWESAIAARDDVMKRTGNQQAATDAFNKAQAAGYDDLRTSGKGGFSKDSQFKMLNPNEVESRLIGYKERLDIDEKDKTTFTKETDQLKKLEAQLAMLKPTDPSAGVLRQQIGELKKHIAKLDAPARTQINMSGPGLTKEQEKLSGDDFLKTLPAATANQVRAIGEGRMLLQDVGVRGAAREKLAALVNQAYPNFDSGDARTNRAIEVDFAKGKPAQSLQSINAVTEHMETYRNLAKALDNGDIQLYNKYKNAFEKATGKTLPNDISAAAPIIGSEIVKAIVPGGGGVEERKAAVDQWNSALSKKQAESQIDNVYIPLMQGQVSGLKQRYEGSGKKDFNTRFLTPGARKALKIDDGQQTKPEAAKPATEHDKAAVAWAKANPNDPRAKKILEMNGG